MKKKKHLIQIKKASKGFLKILETITRKGTNNTKQQPLQQSPGQSLQTKEKSPKEAQLRAGTINIEENFNLSANFIGGKLKKYYEKQKRYTKDLHILGIIKEELKINFSETPFQSGYKKHLRLVQESNNLLTEVRKLLEKEVIVKSKPEFSDISGMFTRDKKDNT